MNRRSFFRRMVGMAMGAVAYMYGVTYGDLLGSNALSARLNHPNPLLRMFTFFDVPSIRDFGNVLLEGPGDPGWNEMPSGETWRVRRPFRESVQ